MDAKETHKYTGKGDTQEDRILRILMDAKGEWVSALDLARIALQYSRAVHFLRRDCRSIENRVEWVGKVRHGFFRLVPDRPPIDLATAPAPDQSTSPVAKPEPPASLFPDQQPVRYVPGGGR